ncbi:MAG: DUF4139 domain-containing protein [Crocinitomicaceae bacterium]|nr:DUF4139 domain-containing protein [Crocinitomicaceae bacterium]
MKKLLLLFVFLPLFGSAQNINVQNIKANIDEVKLYLTAGEIKHQQEIKLTKGRNKLIFSGISAYADPESIQFRSDGSYSIVSVSTEMDFLAAESFNPRISVLKDSMEIMKDAYQENLDIIDSYNAEKDVMRVNRDLGGQSANLTVTQIKEAADYYRKRTLEINRKLSKLKKEQRRYNTKMENTRFQLVELNYFENQRSNQVIVLLDVAQSMNATTSLTYLVSDCGWAATYDLSAQDLKQQINLKYKAQVYNNTGNDWEGIKLILSTADAKLSASAPHLEPWYLSNFKRKRKVSNKLNYYEGDNNNNDDLRQEAISNVNLANQRVYDNYYNGDVSGAVQSERAFNSFKLRNSQDIGNQKAKIEMIEISELSTEFVIESSFSCPSDAKPYIVNVKEMNLDATFSHITVPKLNSSAFLMAHIVGWQDLELMPGKSNVYFGGKYVGVSEISTRNISDTLSLSFGRDDKVLVMRKLKKEFSVKKEVGNSRKDSYMYEVVVRNNRAVPIKIQVFDQIPISNSNDITVTADELSGSEKDVETGEVIWAMTISPSGVQSKELGYTVKYPKNMNVSVNRYRWRGTYKF